MQLLSIVKFDVLVMHLRQLVYPLTQFDSTTSDGTVNSHHLVLSCLVDNLDFLYLLNLLALQLVALGTHLCQLGLIGAGQAGISDVLAGLFELLNEETRLDEQDPTLRVVFLDLQRC